MTEGKRSHIVADAVAAVLKEHGIEDESITNDVMLALSDVRLISYQRKDILPLLTVAGRTLVVIVENPDLTIREIAVRLGTVESNVQRAVSSLVRHGIVQRTRVGRRNQYRVEYEDLLGHPDIWRLLLAIDQLEAIREVSDVSDVKMSTIDPFLTETMAQELP